MQWLAALCIKRPVFASVLILTLTVVGAITITNTIPAGSVSGLGSLATANSVDLATSQVTNKRLANLDSTANTKLAGIAAGSGYAGMVSDGAGAVYDGVAPGADIIAVQVFSRFNSATNCGSLANTPCYLSYTSDQLRGLNWLAGMAGTFAAVAAAVRGIVEEGR